jgi:hypothetical protein
MNTQKPEDIFDQVYNKDQIPRNHSISVDVENGAVDGSVKSIDNKITLWQELANEWRKAIIQNENIIISFWILFGLIYSYAINECTGNFHVPTYVYVMAGIIIMLVSLLLITEGSLPLLVLVKFGVSIAFGHVSMMFLIAADGHTFKIFTTDVCRYPITTDSVMIYMVGVGTGYILAKIGISSYQRRGGK